MVTSGLASGPNMLCLHHGVNAYVVFSCYCIVIIFFDSACIIC